MSIINAVEVVRIAEREAIAHKEKDHKETKNRGENNYARDANSKGC